MLKRVLVTDGMDASAMEKLRADGYEVVEQFYEPDALGAALRDFDAVIIRSATALEEARGVLRTAMPAASAYFTAMLSTPTPARMMSFRRLFLAASI